MKDKWKDFVYENVVEFCNKRGSRTFSLGDFTKQNFEIFQHFKPDNHHIVPLCESGEDGDWNLSVLCAHHHRMAHFARKDDRENIRGYLLGEVARRLE